MSEKCKCPDCNVGEFHMGGCDVERCPFCGGQAFSCGCHRNYLELGEDEDPTDIQWEAWVTHLEIQGRLKWTGDWPNTDACRKFDFWCYEDKSHWGNPEMHYGWIRCDKDHPKAREDYNRLADDCVWSVEEKKYLLKKD